MRIPKPSRGSLILWILIAALVVFLILSMVLRREEPVAEDTPLAAKPVAVAEVASSELVDTVRLPARVEAVYRARLPVDKGGRITELHVDRGDRVTEGQHLVSIDDRIWKAMLTRAEIELREATKDLRRFDDLVAGGAVSTSEYDAVRTRADQAQAAVEEAAAHVSQCRVVSPVDGFVNDRYLDVGEYAPEGAAVLEVVATDPVKVVVDVPERDVGSLAEGNPLTVRFDTLNLGAVTATVTFIAMAADPAAPSYRVEAELANPDGRFRPGMLATATLDRGQPLERIAVPLAAVIPKQGEHFVFIARDGHAVKRLVRIERLLGEQAVLDAGLEPGDPLIVEGHRTLIDGEPVEVTRGGDGG